MKYLNWQNGLFLAALIAVVYALLTIFEADRHIKDLNLGIAVLSALIYIASITIWNIAWGRYFSLPASESIKLGFASQLGGLTPLSLGADFLRGYYSKKAGRKFSAGMAASLASKFHKILLALVFSAIGIGLLIYQHSDLKGSLLLGAGIPIIMLAGVFFLTRNYSPWLISNITLKRIGKEDTAEFSKTLRKFIYSPSKSTILLLFISLVFEF
ncbi:MAG: lysylphosphatidylglycerol synthase domain-containing protein, partial [Candidatus Micrarchaeota archaeon]